MKTLEILRRFEPVKPSGAGKWMARCPAHEDRVASLSIREDNGTTLLKCHAGCVTAEIVSLVGLVMSDLFPDVAALPPPVRRHNGSTNASVATYNYLDANGVLVHQVVRYADKRFSQRRPDGDGWSWNLDGVTRVPYRLAELLEAVKADRQVFLVEGEKDADRLRDIGLDATTNAGGAKYQYPVTWRPYFAGASVVIIPDCDGPGRAAAKERATFLATCAKATRVLDLEPQRNDGFDVSDFLDAGHTKAELLALAAAARSVEPNTAIESAQPVPDDHALDDLRQHQTDLGNAELFAARVEQHVRFNHSAGKWFVFDGRRWAADDLGQVELFAKHVIRGAAADVARLPDPHYKPLMLHLLRSEAQTRLAAMLKLAQSDPAFAVNSKVFDRDTMLLNVANGTIDLKTGALRKHSERDYITKLIPIAYDPQATAPRWERFLDEVFAGDGERVEFARLAAGYSLTGDTSEHCLFILYGGGANGKTTFVETLCALAADYGTQAEFSTFLLRTFDRIPDDVAALAGARLVTATESAEGRRLAESLVKHLTGGDRMRARRLYENSFEFRPQFKLWLATNHRPQIRGTDHAIWRRTRLIPFDVTFPPEIRDPKLAAKLADELPGILAWAVRGCLEWQRLGSLPLPAAVGRATEGYRSDMDVIGAFLEERCEIDAAAEVGKGALYAAYVSWTAASGEKAVTKNDLGVRLAERGFSGKRGAKGRRSWVGMRLLDLVETAGDRSDASDTLF